jgi:hypothetical protein
VSCCVCAPQPSCARIPSMADEVATAASTFVALLDAIATFAPNSRGSVATAKPMPEAPPIARTRPDP